LGRIRDVEYGHAEYGINICFIRTNKEPISYHASNVILSIVQSVTIFIHLIFALLQCMKVKKKL